MARLALPPWSSLIVLITIILNLFSQTVQLILVLTQACDEVLLQIFGKTCALNLGASRYDCVSLTVDRDLSSSLYGDSYVISSGFVLIVAICVPLSLSSLNDNIFAQMVAFFVIILQFLVWVLNFCAMGLDSRLVPAFGTGKSLTPLIPQAFYSFNYLATITATLATKRPDVNGAHVIVTGVSFALAQTLAVSLFGALAISIEGGSNTSLSNILVQAPPPGVWKAATNFAFVFPFANILTAIPVFSIFMQRNVMEYFNPHPGLQVYAAMLITVVAPWVVALAFYPFPTFSAVINWTSAFTVIPMNLTIPVLLYLAHVRRKAAGLPPLFVPESCSDESPERIEPEFRGKLVEAADDDDAFVQQSPLNFAHAPTAGIGASVGQKENSRHENKEPDRPLSWGEVKEGEKVLGFSMEGSKASLQGIRNLLPEGEDDSHNLHCACSGFVSKPMYAKGLIVASILLALAAFALQVDLVSNPSVSEPDSSPASNSTR